MPILFPESSFPDELSSNLWVTNSTFAHLASTCCKPNELWLDTMSCQDTPEVTSQYVLKLSVFLGTCLHVACHEGLQMQMNVENNTHRGAGVNYFVNVIEHTLGLTSLRVTYSVSINCNLIFTGFQFSWWWNHFKVLSNYFLRRIAIHKYIL